MADRPKKLRATLFRPKVAERKFLQLAFDMLGIVFFGHLALSFGIGAERSFYYNTNTAFLISQNCYNLSTYNLILCFTKKY